MDIENGVFGKRIRDMREYQKLSREKLSEMAGISSQFLADIETGRKGMSVVTLKKICDALHTTSDSIVFGNESPSTGLIENIACKIPENKRGNFEQALIILTKLID